VFSEEHICEREDDGLLGVDELECYLCAAKIFHLQMLVNHPCGLGLTEIYGVIATTA